MTFGTGFTWQACEALPEADRTRSLPLGSGVALAERKLDVWFVLHGETCATSAWGARAELGQPVALWGPRLVFEPPADTGSYLLVSDETGLSAMYAVLDDVVAAYAATEVTLIAEFDDVVNRVDFPLSSRANVVGVDRCGAAPGSTPLPIEAMQALDIEAHVYAFGSGGSRQTTEVRIHLRYVRNLPANLVSMTGYWGSP